MLCINLSIGAKVPTSREPKNNVVFGASPNIFLRCNRSPTFKGRKAMRIYTLER
jgi:hypothetical protein